MERVPGSFIEQTGGRLSPNLQDQAMAARQPAAAPIVSAPAPGPAEAAAAPAPVATTAPAAETTKEVNP
jgi:hypothetical protein